MNKHCRCHIRGKQPPRPASIVGRTLTCWEHMRRWVWDGVAFIPDRTFYDEHRTRPLARP